jgi:hypothetical protein
VGVKCAPCTETDGDGDGGGDKAVNGDNGEGVAKATSCTVNPRSVEGAATRDARGVEVDRVRTRSADGDSVLDEVMLLKIELCNPVL